MVDLLWSSALCLRGDNLRSAELYDPPTVFLERGEEERAGTLYPALVLIMDNGKINQSGRIEYGAAV